jgi:hypothetical protein
MNVKDIKGVIFDNVIIYKSKEVGFEDIYKGNTDNIPLDIQNMTIASVGAAKKML